MQDIGIPISSLGGPFLVRALCFCSRAFTWTHAQWAMEKEGERTCLHGCDADPKQKVCHRLNVSASVGKWSVGLQNGIQHKAFCPRQPESPIWVVEIVGEKPWHRRLMARSFDLFYPPCLPKWFWPDWACWQARWKMAGKWHSQLIAGTGLSSPVDFLTFFLGFLCYRNPNESAGF